MRLNAPGNLVAVVFAGTAILVVNGCSQSGEPGSQTKPTAADRSHLLAAGEPFNPRTVIRRPFPAITKFPVVSADRAEGKIGDTELVLGVVVGNEARAYPINMLTGPRREILNDTLGGKPVAATW